MRHRLEILLGLVRDSGYEPRNFRSAIANYRNLLLQMGAPQSQTTGKIHAMAAQYGVEPAVNQTPAPTAADPDGLPKLFTASSSESNVSKIVTRRVMDSRSWFRRFTFTSFSPPAAFDSDV